MGQEIKCDAVCLNTVETHDVRFYERVGTSDVDKHKCTSMNIIWSLCSAAGLAAAVEIRHYVLRESYGGVLSFTNFVFLLRIRIQRSS